MAWLEQRVWAGLKASATVKCRADLQVGRWKDTATF